MNIETEKACRKRSTRHTAKAKMREPTRQGLSKIVECGKCYQTTTVRIPPPPAVTRQKPKAKTTTPTTSQNPTNIRSTNGNDNVNAKSTANASSKKRAKSRKAGLQALLNQAQSSQGSRHLSLADFARK